MQTLSIEEQGLYFLAKVSVRKTPTNPRNRMIFGNRSILLFQNNFWYYAKLFYCLVIYTQSYCQNTLLVYQFCSLSCKIANRFMMLEKIVKWWKSTIECCDFTIYFFVSWIFFKSLLMKTINCHLWHQSAWKCISDWIESFG